MTEQTDYVRALAGSQNNNNSYLGSGLVSRKTSNASEFAHNRSVSFGSHLNPEGSFGGHYMPSGPENNSWMESFIIAAKASCPTILTLVFLQMV